MQLDPPQLIVSDDASGNLYRMPLTIDGSTVTFGAPVEVQRVFTDMPAPAKTTASGRGRNGPEARIAAAVASGKIPSSRAAHYRALAASGNDLAVLDQLVAVPGAGQVAASKTQDDEDAYYRSLFGGGARRRHAGSQRHPGVRGGGLPQSLRAAGTGTGSRRVRPVLPVSRPGAARG
jgi:hypothetical protein